MAPTFDEVAKARYILLTTFTKDGTQTDGDLGGASG